MPTQGIKASIGDFARRLSSSQRCTVCIAACQNRGKGESFCFPQPNPIDRRVIIRIWDVQYLWIIIFYFLFCH